MPFVRSMSDVAGAGLPPGIPTVGIKTLPSGAKRFTKLGDEVKARIREAAADGINDWTNEVAKLSMEEVPKGPTRHRDEGDLSLLDSIRYPGNDPAMAAHAEDLDAGISYDTVYAGVQHEGEAWMTRYDEAGEPYEIHWVVKKYTTPGTKSHYLEDPLKAMEPLLEEYIGRYVREVL